MFVVDIYNKSIINVRTDAYSDSELVHMNRRNVLRKPFVPSSDAKYALVGRHMSLVFVKTVHFRPLTIPELAFSKF